MANDPYWNNVVLAMHMDDVGLTDLKGHAVTLDGNVGRSATQSKFGGYSAYFDGAGDFLSLAANSDWAFGTGNFTIEAFVFPTTLNKWQSIVGQWSNRFDNGFGLYITNANTVALLFKSGSTNYFLYTEVAVSLNAWAHVCAFRIGGTAYLAIDGVIRATMTGVQNLSYGNAALGVKVGSALSVVTDYFTGYIDDIRITKGVARYTDDFTVPTEAFPNTPPQLLGTVRDMNSNLVARTVRSYRRSDGMLAGTAVSSWVDGTFSVNAYDGSAHYVVCLDDGTPDENALILDNITPV